MIKKLVSVLLCSALLFSYAYADEDVLSPESSETKVYSLTLNEAIEIALTDNPQILVCETSAENLKKQLEAAKINKAHLKDVRKVSASSGYEAKYIKGGYYVHSCEAGIMLNELENKQIRSKIAYNVTQKYYNLKNCEKLVNIAADSYNLVLGNYNNAVISYGLGIISKNDLDNTEIGVKRAKYMLELYQNNLDIAREDFKIALRKNSENCTFVLTDEIVCEDFNADIGADLMLAKENRYDLAGLKSSYELAKEYFDLTGLTSDSATYTSAYSKYITAEYNYTNNSDLILLGVKSAYNSAVAAKNDADVAQTNLALKEDAYNIAKIKHEQGMITNSELSSALIDASQAEIENENAKLTYKLAQEKYKYEISIGL